MLSSEAIDLMTEDRIARVYDGSVVDFFGSTWGQGLGFTIQRETGRAGTGAIWGGGTFIDRDAGVGLVLVLESNFFVGGTLDWNALQDAIVEAVMAARG